MIINNKEFRLAVVLAMFKVENKPVSNIKKLPEKQLMVLLNKRIREPHIGCWQFPYGFVQPDESLDNAVYRELKENTDFDNLYFEQLYTWGAVDRDPTARVVAASYLAILHNGDDNANNINNKNIGDMQWFSVTKTLVDQKSISISELNSVYRITLKYRSDIISYLVTENTVMTDFEKRTKYSYAPCSETIGYMAYDHMKILDYALDRIKNKVLYTNIAFGLISKTFTLTELQQVYEVLLGKKLIKPNFRRWIGKKVEETSETRKSGAYRPSKLFQLKKEILLDEPDMFDY